MDKIHPDWFINMVDEPDNKMAWNVQLKGDAGFTRVEAHHFDIDPFGNLIFYIVSEGNPPMSVAVFNDTEWVGVKLVY